MVQLKWLSFFLLCIFAPTKGCVLHKFFEKPVVQKEVVLQAPYGNLYVTSNQQIFSLYLPLDQIPDKENVGQSLPAQGWLVFGKDKTHLPAKIVKIEEKKGYILAKVELEQIPQALSLFDVALKIYTD